MADRRTATIRVPVTTAEKESLQRLANDFTNGNVAALLRNRALGIADVAAPNPDAEPAALAQSGRVKEPGPVERVLGRRR